MRISSLTLLSGTLLVGWSALSLLDTITTLTHGAATVFLPVSLILLLVHEMRAKRSPFDLAILFLTSCLFFFCIGVILWPVSSFSPQQFESLVIASFTLERLDQSAALVGVSIAITMLTLGVCRSTMHRATPPVFEPLPDARAPSLFRFGLALMLLSLPLVTVELWRQLQYIQETSYLALYAEGVPSSPLAAFFYVFYTGFGLVITYARTRRQMLLPALLYLGAATLDSLKGTRGAVLVPLLFVAWYYASRFNVKFRLAVITRNLALLIGLFAFLTYQRDASLFDAGIGQFLVDALSTQGRSLQLTALYREVADEVARYGNNMFTSNLLIPFIAVIHPEVREAAQSMDQVLYSNNLKHILTYVLNETYYFAGGGTGGVYTIELIEAGPVLYVLLSMGLGFFLSWLPAAMRKPWVRFLSIYFFSTIFYLPRAELFFNTLIVGKALFLFLLVITLHEILRRRTPTQPAPESVADA